MKRTSCVAKRESLCECQHNHSKFVEHPPRFCNDQIPRLSVQVRLSVTNRGTLDARNALIELLLGETGANFISIEVEIRRASLYGLQESSGV